MAVAALVVFLAGLVFPILLLLAAILFDVGVLLWSLYRLWTDRWAPQLVRAFGSVARPVQRSGHVASMI